MSFLGEIKRRKIFQVAAVYAVVAWLIVQIVAVIEAPLHLPDWFDTATIVLLAIGFPITLIMSWGFNLTPDGVVREDGGSEVASTSGFRIEYALFGVIAIALLWLVYRVEFDGSEQATVTPADNDKFEGIAAEESPLDVLPNSIAVLPFENLSPDPDNAYFAAGIHESTLNELSKIDDLAVMSRSSVLQYAENRPPIRNIAKELNVEVVMEGSVRYADGRVLITAQLIDGRTDEHIWSDEFEEELTDVFKVQREIAVNIANAMHLELLPEVRAYIGSRPTTSPKAYQHFLQALSFPSPWIFPEHRPAIIEALKDAIAIDDEFAEAYGWLADAYYSPPRDRELAVEFARKALALDEDNARAYVVLGMEARYYFDRLDEARYYFERAIELAPNQTSSMQPARHLAELDGSYSRSIQLFRRLIAQHPDFPPSRTMLGFLYLRSGNLSAAREQTSLAIRLLPGDYNNYSNLAAVEYLRGDLEAARHNLNRAITLMSPSAVFRSDYIAYLFGLTGDTDRAYSLLSQHDVQLDDPQNAAWETLGWAVLGTRDKDRALEVWQATINGYLDEGKPVSSGRITRFRDNWLNDPMLEEPEFIELRRRLGYEG